MGLRKRLSGGCIGLCLMIMRMRTARVNRHSSVAFLKSCSTLSAQTAITNEKRMIIMTKWKMAKEMRGKAITHLGLLRTVGW